MLGMSGFPHAIFYMLEGVVVRSGMAVNRD